MADELNPADVDELADHLRRCGAERKTVELGGHFTKRTAGGEIKATDVVMSTAKLDRVLAYEPADLTVSVEAGLPFGELTALLARSGQSLPLDPPFDRDATVGGVIATNGSGPRRRRFGTARDMVIGMEMVTVEGKRIKTGGMVVKNVTGLDMGKLMIGSCGTLACISSVNFKVFPRPAAEKTFVLSSEQLTALLKVKSSILNSYLQPVAIDLLNPEAVAAAELEVPAGYALAVAVAGTERAVFRYSLEYQKLAVGNQVEFSEPDGVAAAGMWAQIQNLTPKMLGRAEQCSVIRCCTTLARVAEIFDAAGAAENGRAAVVRAGTGTGYVYCHDLGNAQALLRAARSAGIQAVVEHSPIGVKQALEHWAEPGREFEIMQRIKHQLDPQSLLNPGRLHNLL